MDFIKVWILDLAGKQDDNLRAIRLLRLAWIIAFAMTALMGAV